MDSKTENKAKQKMHEIRKSGFNDLKFPVTKKKFIPSEPYKASRSTDRQYLNKEKARHKLRGLT